MKINNKYALGVGVATVCVGVALVAGWLTYANRRPKTKARTILSEFDLDRDTLKKIVSAMLRDMDKGLLADGGDIKMIPSFVTRKPTGSETGAFLALDLGGTNLRVYKVVLLGDSRPPTMRQQKFRVSEALKTGDGQTLFDYIADCVAVFLTNCDNDEGVRTNLTSHWKLGFTFSFPVLQTAINEGTLIVWTEGYTAKNVENRDPVKLLHASFLRKKLDIHITALANDTVGTLVSLAYSRPETQAGVILGTGSNCAYVEFVSNIKKLPASSPYDQNAKEMIINMEWGSFGESLPTIPRTPFDTLLDAQTLHPGEYTFEKLISGMYLGELVRLILVDLYTNGVSPSTIIGTTATTTSPPMISHTSASLSLLPSPPRLFNQTKQLPATLTTAYAFETAYMSRIERDYSFGLFDVKSVLEDVCGLNTTSVEDRECVKRVCEAVGVRSARLAAAGVAAVVTRISRNYERGGGISSSGIKWPSSSSSCVEGVTLGVDGSLFELYPHYENRMRDALREILGEAQAAGVRFERAVDGSGIGAALIAALAEV